MILPQLGRFMCYQTHLEITLSLVLFSMVSSWFVMVSDVIVAVKCGAVKGRIKLGECVTGFQGIQDLFHVEFCKWGQGPWTRRWILCSNTLCCWAGGFPRDTGASLLDKVNCSSPAWITVASSRTGHSLLASCRGMWVCFDSIRVSKGSLESWRMPGLWVDLGHWGQMSSMDRIGLQEGSF